MATKEFPLVPKDVGRIETRFRRIITKIPVPESIPILEQMRTAEPRSMGGQPSVIWDSGEGALVRDPYGNQWIDFSSGVLVTSAGHAHPRIVEAIQEIARNHLYHAYCFPTEIRARLVTKIKSLLPPHLSRIFLLTTGSEAVECAIKLARTMGLKIGGPEKRVIVSFENAFHGRTMGAQLAGGIPSLKAWLGNETADFVQVPYPDGFRCPDMSFEVFTRTLSDKGINPSRVCGVISETYQGCNAFLIPADYARALRKWCDEHRAVLILDEIQAGFGRTGRMFGFEHLGIVPDLAVFGKGISGGMPLSAVVGTEELMNLYGPGEMTSTHSANPICAAAALTNIEIILEENLVENARRLQPVLLESGRKMIEISQGRIGRADGVGLVMALQFVEPQTTNPDPETAWEVVRMSVERGVMLFAPVGVGGSTIKINPPLLITEEQLREGLSVVEEVVAEVCR
ncbi:MAG: aspartate aminotransferase family protein [Armatimonadetes bacterium]|nr:aspartate aminotransferase family protein [Armatimonadota bacterium]